MSTYVGNVNVAAAHHVILGQVVLIHNLKRQPDFYSVNWGVKGEFCMDNLLVRIHFIIVIIWWPGLAPWEFEFPFPDSLISTVLDELKKTRMFPR